MKKNKVRAACVRKVKYATREEAGVACGRLKRRTGTTATNIYKCGHCGQWHVGHLPGFVRRAMGL